MTETKRVYSYAVPALEHPDAKNEPAKVVEQTHTHTLALSLSTGSLEATRKTVEAGRKEGRYPAHHASLFKSQTRVLPLTDLTLSSDLGIPNPGHTKVQNPSETPQPVLRVRKDYEFLRWMCLGQNPKEQLGWPHTLAELHRARIFVEAHVDDPAQRLCG